MKNLRLKYRILLVYSIPLALSIVVAVLVFFSIRQVQYESKLVENRRDILNDTKDVAYNAAKMQRAVRGYLYLQRMKFL